MIQAKIVVACERIDRVPGSGGGTGRPVDEPGGPSGVEGETDCPVDENGEPVHTWACPFDGNCYKYRYDSAAQSAEFMVLDGDRRVYLAGVERHDCDDVLSMFEQSKPTYDEVVPETIQGDELGCTRCPTCGSRHCGRGGFRSAVRYSYFQYPVGKEILNEHGRWVRCTNCSLDSERFVTVGRLGIFGGISAVVRNSQRPYLPPLMTLEELCDDPPIHPGEPPGATPDFD